MNEQTKKEFNELYEKLKKLIMKFLLQHGLILMTALIILIGIR